jgi:hypothetical protein
MSLEPLSSGDWRLPSCPSQAQIHSFPKLHQSPHFGYFFPFLSYAQKGSHGVEMGKGGWPIPIPHSQTSLDCCTIWGTEKMAKGWKNLFAGG